MTGSQSEPMYISLRDSSCIHSNERTFRTTPSTSTLFVQSFRLNAWFFVALILWFKPIWEGMLFPSVPNEGVIWATPDFGKYLRFCYLRALVDIKLMDLTLDQSKLLFKSEKRRSQTLSETIQMEVSFPLGTRTNRGTPVPQTLKSIRTGMNL